MFLQVFKEIPNIGFIIKVDTEKRKNENIKNKSNKKNH